MDLTAASAVFNSKSWNDQIRSNDKLPAMRSGLKIGIGVMLGGIACLCGMMLAGGFGICGPSPLGLFLTIIGMPAFVIGLLAMIFQFALIAIEKHRSNRA